MRIEQQIEESTGKVLVDFYAEWCTPCKMMNPMMGRFMVKHEKDVQVFKVNVEHHPAFTTQHDITTVPYFMLYENGKIVKEHAGTFNEIELERFVFE